MRGKDGTFFTPENCLDPHFIVTGSCNDCYCGDTLQLTGIEYELSRHLRENGFDAVFFLDISNMLYCFDDVSHDILLNGKRTQGPPAQQAAPSPAGRISGIGPLGHRRRSIQEARPAPRRTEEAAPPGQLHMGRMTIAAAWNQVLRLIQRQEYRCALVISNMNATQGTVNAQVLRVLQGLSSYGGGKQSIAVYIFRENEFSTLVENAQNGSEEWRTLLNTILRVRVESADPERNHVINLGTPNASEVRNLLHHLRLRAERPLPVRAADVNRLAAELSGACSRMGWGLTRLMERLENHVQTVGGEISYSVWREITGEKNHRSALEELDALIGLDGVKASIHEWYESARRKAPAELEFPRYSSRFAPRAEAVRRRGQELNVRLLGRSGTGKTTIARLIGQLYYEMGLLPEARFVEVNAADLVSGYVGMTSSQVRGYVQNAMGGVLFIDEAYALMNGAHGREAIDQLVAEMSVHEGELAVVIAGYSRDMEELMRQNDGLSMRFPQIYRLPDYTPEEMRRILEKLAADDPEQVEFSDGLREQLGNFCEAWVGQRGGDWGNAREAQALLSQMKRRCGARLAAQARENQARTNVLEMDVQDIPENLRPCLKKRSENLNEALEEINRMIGLKNVKQFLRNLCDGVLWEAEEHVPGNYIFSGPPGTGKTLTARNMGELLWRLGVLRRTHVAEYKAADLLAGDNPAGNLREAVEGARGGILFIDEAHQLADSPRGQAVIRALVPLIEAPEIRLDTCFICAGYASEMRRFLAVDSGLERRFPQNHRIQFEDYSAAELTEILEQMARQAGEIPSADYLARSRAALERYMERRPRNFGNGGFIRDTYLPDSIQARTARLNREHGCTGGQVAAPEMVAKLSYEEKHTLTALDIPPAFRALAGPPGAPVPPPRDASARLNELVGKEAVVEYAKSRTSQDANTVFADEQAGIGLHFAFTGPAGSGRHMAVSALAAVWHEHGLLQRDDVLFVSKGDLEAGYVGQTAIRTAEQIEQIRGGTLAVVSPSSLLAAEGRSGASYGPEALGAILNAMGGMGDLSVVFLDTAEGMERVFRQFPALQAMLAHTFRFEDFSPQEMEELFHLKADGGMRFAPELESLLPDFFLNWVSERGGLGEAAQSWGNGMELDRLLEQLRQNWKQSNGKTVQENGGSYRLITKEMLPKGLQKYCTASKAVAETAMEELNQLTGLSGVKAAVRRIERYIRRMPGRGAVPGNYCFIGNPGVGKTKVANLMGGILKAAGVLSQGHLIVRKAAQLAAPDALDQAIKLAKNGVLFIDEAHQLAESGYGQGVIKQLVTVLEDVDITSCTSIILAGYPDEMMFLLQCDQGLASRFGTQESIIRFEDYTPEELLQILEQMAAAADKIPQIGSDYPLHMDGEYRACALEVFECICAQRSPQFGNARFVRNYLHDSLSALLYRLDEEYGLQDDPPFDVRDLLTKKDMPLQYRKLLALQERGREALVSRGQIVTQPRGTVLDRTHHAQFFPTVVLLEAEENGRTGYATGTIVTKEGHVLTCAHVAGMEGRLRARVYTPGAVGGDYRWFDCQRLLPQHEDCDMALLKMEGQNFSCAPLRPAEEPILDGEETLIAGYPLGAKLDEGNPNELKISTFMGRLSSDQGLSNKIRRYYVDTTALHGNSGSPVISLMDGRVIGVFSGSVRQGKESLDELNYFYPIGYFWERMTRGGAEPFAEEE